MIRTCLGRPSLHIEICSWRAGIHLRYFVWESEPSRSSPSSPLDTDWEAEILADLEKDGDYEVVDDDRQEIDEDLLEWIYPPLLPCPTYPAPLPVYTTKCCIFSDD